MAFIEINHAFAYYLEIHYDFKCTLKPIFEEVRSLYIVKFQGIL